MAERLDRALPSRGLARSRTAAARLIDSGAVAVNGVTTTKVAQQVDDSDRIEITEPERYVSRAAYKLLAALEQFEIQPRGRVVLDLGASTGGFTQVLLEREASEVIALDVGHDQLDPIIRSDTRVTVIEGENARFLNEDRLNAVIQQNRDARPPIRAGEISLVVGDLSFISLRHILPVFLASAPNLEHAILLVKPQFEVGRTHVKGGIVMDPEVAAEAAIDIVREAIELGWIPRSYVPSPLTGTHGNQEFLLWLSRSGDTARQWEDHVRTVTMKGAT
ncbi:TlyA family RNA methyltransferase [Gulosibacter molinativorax]|uniref:TlyA family RNA methyltransferase n=1 Tax=Gulosibacter molinativorax TaxID=256821 RepID=A0ABT7CB22_9MICO|nr:TlyA family RNA methyltransferase [Gulosibacter molinativorax]MDJ1372384.1 TlyA family RNA methyltransferase [Gulosibacter molinativorax]QUY61100.1 16S/23S rRNA (Cytidine-2'-O)-methyltransferase TlyA [Gulosibacter molinativorax]